MTTTIVWSDQYASHDTGAHPESPERIHALRRALEAAGMFDDREVIAPTPVGEDTTLGVHSASVPRRVRETAESGGGWLDPDTFVSPESFQVALLVAGGACAAVDAVMSGSTRRAFALGRPPGHHAEPLRSMGFCLFNNIAIAARHAQQQYELERIAIVDWDVHHGNGTQAIFWSDPSVLFISLHQYPFYPGTGSAAERGVGAGEGTTINLPLPAGSDDAVYLDAFASIVAPSVRAFAPELVLVSAGFDAHADDPLAMMRMSTDGFRALARGVATLADETAEGRLVLVLEGGYNLNALGESVVAVLRELDSLD